MEEKKAIKISLSTFFLILTIIVIIVMSMFICKIYNEKEKEIEKSAELQTQVNKLNEMVSDLQGKINIISDTISNTNDKTVENSKEEIDINSQYGKDNDTVVKNNKNLEDIADITDKCKTAFEEYYNLQEEFYSGGSLYVLKKLDLVSTIPDPEQYETTTYEFDNFYKTDIKYSDFKNAMLKYMTSELLEKEFEESYAKNVNGYLQITAMGRTATYIDIDKFELSSNDEDSYVFDLSGEKRYDNGAPKSNINMKITFEKQNGNYIVSNIEK